MCGIAAAVWRGEPRPEAVRAISQEMQTRGPDGSGEWHCATASLAHRRLAVIDVDHRADQPMTSGSGRLVMIFNGEIYNYQTLRAELVERGVPLRTHSDSEVLLELFERHGPEVLSRLRGMFAVAIWDTHTERLFVARDGYGIKPLYLARTRGGVLVASSVKALLASGLVSRDPDPQGVASFWLSGSVAEPRTWFRDVEALPAGHFAWLSPQSASTASESWCEVGAEFVVEPGAGDDLSSSDLQDLVRAALRESVDYHTVADVPVGVFLSGGIDSGAIAALLAEQSSTPATGVTLTFAEYAGRHEDETGVAAGVARRYGLDFHSRVVTQREFADDLPAFLACMDEPTVDGLNTWFVSKAARELDLKVVMSGVGGDELFQGYDHYRRIPYLLRVGRAMRRVPGARAAALRLGAEMADRRNDGRWRQLAGAMTDVTSLYALTRGLFSLSDLPELMGTDLLGEISADSWVRLATGDAALLRLPGDPRLALSSLESRLYLRNQLLRDSDWASMAHSLELRTPLVDRFLLQRLGPHLARMKDFPGKALLAGSPAPPLPEAVTKRRKTGFSVPTTQWMADLTGGQVTTTRQWCRYVGQSYGELA